MVEQRKYRRFKSKMLVVTIYRDENGKININDEVFSEDISAAGIKIIFPRQLPRGQLLDLKLYLFSDPINLPAEGRVVWCKETQNLEIALDTDKEKNNKLFWVGVQFINVDSFTRQRLLRWIKRNFEVEDNSL